MANMVLATIPLEISQVSWFICNDLVLYPYYKFRFFG